MAILPISDNADSVLCDVADFAAASFSDHNLTAAERVNAAELLAEHFEGIATDAKERDR